jgi:hypothetical protein
MRLIAEAHSEHWRRAVDPLVPEQAVFSVRVPVAHEREVEGPREAGRVLGVQERIAGHPVPIFCINGVPLITLPDAVDDSQMTLWEVEVDKVRTGLNRDLRARTVSRND